MGLLRAPVAVSVTEEALEANETLSPLPRELGGVGRGAENHVQTRRERRWPEPRVRDVLSSLEARHVDHSSLGKGKTEETSEIKRDAQDRKLYG